MTESILYSLDSHVHHDTECPHNLWLYFKLCIHYSCVEMRYNIALTFKECCFVSEVPLREGQSRAQMLIICATAAFFFFRYFI